MPLHDFRSQRLFVDAPLKADARIALDRAQANYLLNVLRMGEGGGLLVFNGRDGEWRAKLVPDGRKSATLVCEVEVRPQPEPADLHYLFAPLKAARLDYAVQKAVEMGASKLVPVITRFTQVSRLKPEKMRAHAIEAAEQCGILALPEITDDVKLSDAIAALEPERVLIFCDEDATLADPVQALQSARGNGATTPPLAVLIGPEGGFSPDEREMLLARKAVLQLSLGPRILRADTAGVAALALVQAVLGDWRDRG
ncbi:MAG: 16S rRNA (uracil(1498)-N(3))-methyltransferase [Bosea sp. (in: a-proteobacteria)]